MMQRPRRMTILATGVAACILAAAGFLVGHRVEEPLSLPTARVTANPTTRGGNPIVVPPLPDLPRP